MTQRFYKRTGRYTRDAQGRVCEIVDIYERRSDGMGGLIDSLTKIGTALLGVFGAHHGQQKPQDKQLQQQFDALTLQAEDLFHAIQTKLTGTVTQADYQAAQQAVAKLDSIASQAPSLQSLWNTASYKPAFQNGLAKIQAMVTQDASNPQSSTTTTPPTGALNIAGMEIPTWAIVAVAAFFLLKG